MYKNQLQELAQRSCFNLPCYTCTREGPDHAPRFKACVNFNGEIFHAPTYCTTLRQAEHAAAEVALNALSTRVPSRFLAAKVLDEIGVYKNLLQESVHRAGLNLPVYTTERSGPGHLPVFISIVELAGMNFTGESARTKKQAEKNAAMAAWSALRQLSNVASSTTSQTNKESECCEEQEHVVVARVLSKFRPKDENRTPRQSDQNQVRRRRMVSSYRDNNNSNSVSSSSRAFMQQQQQQWRQGMSSCEFSSKPQKQQRGSIIAHLSSTISSKMLLPTSSSTDRSSSSSSSSSYSVCPPNKTGIQVEVRSKSQVMIQDIPTPLEEHQKDEDEWLYGRVDTDSIIEKSMEKSCNSRNSNSVTRPIVVTCQYRPFIGGHHAHENTRSIFAGTMCYGPPPSVQMLNGGGGYHGHGHGHGIAPPVHIRSVIPVCAAPPPPPPSNSQIAVAPATAQKKQQDISGSESSSVLKKQTEEEEAEAAAARSKLNDLHL